MAGNYRKRYDVDIVFVIDATGSMVRCIETVKENASKFYDDVCEKMRDTGREIHKMRTRIIAFRDYIQYTKDKIPPMIATQFFNMPDDVSSFHEAVKAIEARGGGDIPEDSLEALAFAIRSRWMEPQPGIDRRQIIVLWTDAPAHPLGYGKNVDIYPKEMAKDIAELTEWWGEQDMEALARQEAGKGYVSYEAKRLLLYAPKTEPWTTISSGWKNVFHVGTTENQYEKMLDAFTRTKEYQEMVELLIKTI